MKKHNFIVIVIALFMAACVFTTACDIGGNKNLDKQKTQTEASFNDTWKQLENEGYDLTDYASNFDQYLENLKNAEDKEELNKVKEDFDYFIQKIKDGDFIETEDNTPTVIPPKPESEQQKLVKKIQNAMSAVYEDYQDTLTELEKIAATVRLAEVLIAVETTASPDLTALQTSFDEAKQYTLDLANGDKKANFKETKAKAETYIDYLVQSTKDKHPEVDWADYNDRIDELRQSVTSAQTEEQFVSEMQYVSYEIEMIINELEEKYGDDTGKTDDIESDHTIDLSGLTDMIEYGKREIDAYWNDFKESVGNEIATLYQDKYYKCIAEINDAKSTDEVQTLVQQFMLTMEKGENDDKLPSLRQYVKGEAISKWVDLSKSLTDDELSAYKQKYEKFLSDVDKAKSAKEVNSLLETLNAEFETFFTKIALNEAKEIAKSNATSNYNSISPTFHGDFATEYKNAYEKFLSDIDKATTKEQLTQLDEAYSDAVEHIEFKQQLAKEKERFDSEWQSLIRRYGEDKVKKYQSTFYQKYIDILDSSKNREDLKDFNEWDREILIIEGELSNTNSGSGNGTTDSGDGTTNSVDAYRQAVLHEIENMMQGLKDKYPSLFQTYSATIQEYHERVEKTTSTEEIGQIFTEYQGFCDQLYAEMDKLNEFEQELSSLRYEIIGEAEKSYHAAIEDYDTLRNTFLFDDTKFTEWESNLDLLRDKLFQEANTKEAILAVKPEFNKLIESIKTYKTIIEYKTEMYLKVSDLLNVWLRRAVDTSDNDADLQKIFNEIAEATTTAKVDAEIQKFLLLLTTAETGRIQGVQYYVEYVTAKMSFVWDLLGQQYVDGTNEYLEEYGKLVDEVEILADHDASGTTSDDVQEKSNVIYAKFEDLIEKVKNYKKA